MIRKQTGFILLSPHSTCGDSVVTFLLILGVTEGCLLSLIFVLGLCPKIKTRKTMMDIKVKREESKLPLFSDN